MKAPKIDMERIGMMLRDRRVHLGLSTSEIGDAIGSTSRTINRAERGDGSVWVIVNMALLMGMSLDELFYESYAERGKSDVIDDMILKSLKRCDVQLKHKVLSIIKILVS